MLKKIIAVRNVGRFINSASQGVPACGRTTLVLGGNGFGKTTLCAVLRSLAVNDPAIVIGRARVGTNATPHIELLLDCGTATFRNGAWSIHVPEFAIFDGTFIAENVHSGDVVDIEQKRNLYRVIVGEVGVGLAIEEDRLAAQSRATISDIKTIGKAIESHLPSGVPAAEFISFPTDPEIDVKIAAQAQTIEAVRAADEVRRRGPLAPVHLPTLPPDIEAVLGKTLDGIAEDAQRRITAHIAQHSMGERGEAWLQQGVDYMVHDSCPYCGQSVEALSLIDAYRKVFADSYRELKAVVDRIRGLIERDFGDRAIGSLDMFVEANRGGVEFWRRYCKLPELASLETMRSAVSDLGTAALALLAAKAATPQEAVALGPDFSAAVMQFELLRAAVDRYNGAITIANAEIAAKKGAVGSGDIKKEELALARLEAQKKRHDPKIAVLCSEYQRLLNEKEGLDAKKARVRTQLEEHTNKIIKPYEGRINQLLDNFNAGFNIARTKPAYAGGVASSTYQIVINNTEIELGNSKTPTNRPSFRNTLSAGDRSTLALALFIAHLEGDPDLANRMVVFDDPFTSQDSFRRRQTIHEMKRLGDVCKQLIVFSHDAVFLRQIRDKCKPVDCVVLQLADLRSQGVKIMPCDLDAVCRGRAASDMDDLQAYITTGAGKTRDIIRKMRVVLETHCRFTYPALFAPDDLLGEMVGKIRRTGDQHPAWALMDELDHINEYSRDHHHGEDPQDGSADMIDPQELTGFVKRTLRIANSLQA